MKNYVKGAVLSTIPCLSLLVTKAYAIESGYEEMAGDLGWAGGGSGTGVEELVILIIQYALGISGLIAVIFLVMGGFSYITAAGNEETTKKATKTIVNAVIGLIIVFAAYAIVYTVKNRLLEGVSA